MYIPAHSSPPSRRAQRGFTFVEILVASMIAGIALAAVSWTMASAVEAKSVLSEDPLPYVLAREIRELAETLPRTPSGVVGVTLVSQALALDSLHGAVFSPPVRANRTTQTSLSGWAQHVTLALCTLDDPSTPTGESPTLGIGRNAQRLYRLSVDISFAGQDVDHFVWWLTP